MARRPTGNDTILKKALDCLATAKTTEDALKARAVIMPLQGYSLDETAAVLGLTKWRVCRIRNEFVRNNGESVIKQDRGGRRHENMTTADEVAFLAPFFVQVEQGEPVEIADIKNPLELHLGRPISLASVYNLLNRHGWRRNQGTENRDNKEAIGTQFISSRLAKHVNIINIDSRLPNLALEKVKAYYREKGFSVVSNPQMAGKIETYVSVLFEFNKEQVQRFEGLPGVTIGGTGYDVKRRLPPEIDAMRPKINIGYVTRGCMRRCPWCHVSQLDKGISKGIEIELLSRVALLKQGKVTSLLHGMGIESIAIRASSIYSHPKAVHAVEQSYKNLRPDILSYVDKMNGRLLFAWEIFVTHEVDEDKFDLLMEYNIPFVELYPIENGKSGYIFLIKSYGGFDLLDSDNHLNSFIKDEYKRELIDLYSKDLEKNIFDARLLEAKKNWDLEHQRLLDQKSNHKLKSDISNLGVADVVGLQGALSTTIYPRTQSRFDYRCDGDDWIPIESIDSERYQGGYYITVNKKYLFLSALGMLRGIYEKLSAQNMLMGLVTKNTDRNEEILIGAKLFIQTSNPSLPFERKSQLLKHKDAETSEIEIWETSSKKSKMSDKYHMYVNDGIFVDSYDTQLKNIIYHLMQHYSMEAHIGVTDQNKKRVDAIRIRGLIDMEMVKDALAKCFKV
jgi:hypothetical protein